jgi:hypothetical protein
MAKQIVYDFVVADRNMVARGAGFSWRSYTDTNGVFGNPGERVIFDDGTKDREGKPIGKAFSVNQSHYKLQARKEQKDTTGKLLVDVFRNAPFCLGSPNGIYTDADGSPVDGDQLRNIKTNLEKIKSGELIQHNVKIKELDDELDAKIALETGLKRAEAQISAGQIDEQTLREIAAMIGEFDKPEKTLRLKVYEYAGKRPIDYFSLLNSGDRSIRAVIRMAEEKGILIVKGTVYYWKDTTLGHNEDLVVSKLMEDKALLESLKEAVDFKSDKNKKKK